MKRLAAILLTTLFLYNTLGYYFVFRYNQDLIRSEMKGLIRAKYQNTVSTTITITNPLADAGYKRLNRGEFLYNGALYDIISESTSGNTVTFKCVSDKKEEQLLAGFRQVIDLTSGQNDPAKTKHAQSLLRHLVTVALVEIDLFQPKQFPSEIKYLYFNDPLQLALNRRLFHPPKVS